MYMLKTVFNNNHEHFLPFLKKNTKKKNKKKNNAKVHLSKVLDICTEVLNRPKSHVYQMRKDLLKQYNLL